MNCDSTNWTHSQYFLFITTIPYSVSLLHLFPSVKYHFVHIRIATITKYWVQPYYINLRRQWTTIDIKHLVDLQKKRKSSTFNDRLSKQKKHFSEAFFGSVRHLFLSSFTFPCLFSLALLFFFHCHAMPCHVISHVIASLHASNVLKRFLLDRHKMAVWLPFK